MGMLTSSSPGERENERGTLVAARLPVYSLEYNTRGRIYVTIKDGKAYYHGQLLEFVEKSREEMCDGGGSPLYGIKGFAGDLVTSREALDILGVTPWD